MDIVQTKVKERNFFRGGRNQVYTLDRSISSGLKETPKISLIPNECSFILQFNVSL